MFDMQIFSFTLTYLHSDFATFHQLYEKYNFLCIFCMRIIVKKWSNLYTLKLIIIYLADCISFQFLITKNERAYQKFIYLKYQRLAINHFHFCRRLFRWPLH